MIKSQPIDQKKTTDGRRRSRQEPGYPASSVATLAGFDGKGQALVYLPGGAGGDSVPARQACPLSAEDVGREAVLTFDNGDPARPIIMGLLQSPGAQPPPAILRSRDGGRIEITAGHEIVLQCGKSSITLTRAGKVLIRGAYLLSRSSGVNRIKGGSVQIN